MSRTYANGYNYLFATQLYGLAYIVLTNSNKFCIFNETHSLKNPYSKHYWARMATRGRLPYSRPKP